jgi:hypothetical protein
LAERYPVDEGIAGRTPSGDGAELQPDVDGTLLYVEESPPNPQLMELIVGRVEGLSMISAHTAALGIGLAKSGIPDPIIPLSANAMSRDIEKGVEAGFGKYLQAGESGGARDRHHGNLG